LEAFSTVLEDGTYELCGPKVGTNAERFEEHKLVRHGCEEVAIPEFSFSAIKGVLMQLDIEGVVFHGTGGKMCKIRKSDFGFMR